MSGFDCAPKLDQIRDGDRLDLIANEIERAEIARRLGLLGLSRLEAHVALGRDGVTIRASGRLKASLEQACVATGEPVAAMVDEAFDLRFLPEPQTHADEEVELGEADLDIIFHDGQSIELGGALADTLALALDPYPRSADADAAMREAGVMTEEDASPFAALAALKGKLSGK